MCTAAILAGGQGRRLGGREKDNLPVGGLRIIDRQLAVLRQVATHVLIVATQPERFAGLDAEVVADLVPHAGPLGGIYTALVAAPTPQALVVACDLPFLTVSWLHHVVAAGREADAAVPRGPRGYEPLCASYSRVCLEPIRRRLDAGVLAVIGFLADVQVREIGPEEMATFDPDGTLLMNVNTPQDYARAQAHIASQRR